MALKKHADAKNCFVLYIQYILYINIFKMETVQVKYLFYSNSADEYNPD